MAEIREIRIEDESGNIYYPHNAAEVTFLKNGKSLQDFFDNGGDIGGDIKLVNDKIIFKNSNNGIEYGFINDKGFFTLNRYAGGAFQENAMRFDTENVNMNRHLSPLNNLTKSLGTEGVRWQDAWVGELLKAVNGYNKLSNGFIEQWGVVNISGQAANSWCTAWSIQYPKMFPNAIVSLDIQILVDGNNHDADLRVLPYLTENINTFQYHCKVGANGTLKFRWRALGY